MRLDLQLLETFLAVVEERNFGRAAEVRFVSAPTIGKHIARLEAQLGTRLIGGTSNGQVTLTPAGARLAERAGVLLDHEHSLQRIVRAPSATVVLGYPAPGDGQPVPAVFAAARRLAHLRHPDLTLVWRRTPLPLLRRWVLQGTVDVQLYAGPVRHPRLRSTSVGFQPLLAAVGLDDPLAAADGLAVGDLTERPMLYDPDVPTDFMDVFWLADMRSRREARLVSVVARDSRAVLQHVVRGAGVTVVPPLPKDMVPPGVHVLPLRGARALALHAVTRLDDRRHEVALAVDLLTELLSDLGPKGVSAEAGTGREAPARSRPGHPDTPPR